MGESWLNRLFRILAVAMLCVHFAFAQATSADSTSKSGAAAADSSSLKIKTENKLSIVGLLLTHYALRNSKSLHDWPFFAFAVPAWSSAVKVRKDVNPFLSVKTSAVNDWNFAGVGIKLDASLELIHLLELGMQGTVGTALNYGETATFMGVYDPEKRDYHQDYFFTEYTYGLQYHASVTLPLLAFLPKSRWTKIILKANGEYAYSAYTNADDGEVWKAGNENQVNGSKYKCGLTLIYMLPSERFPMAMLAGGVSGFKHEYEFDEAYRDYNPAFKTCSITPMLSVNISEKWKGLLMAAISRDRKFEQRHYESSEEILQKQVGAEWNLKTILFIATREF